MHDELMDELARRMRDRATDVVWIQWASLGSGAVAKRAPGSVIDPEALVLASLGLVEHERHLAGLLAWWAAEGPGLMSVQRMRNLSSSYPERVRERLGEFAGYARRVGGDHRWKVLATESEGEAEREAPRPPRLSGPGGVLMRLRLGFGVGIKADLLAALQGTEGWWTVREAAVATGYTSRAVRRAGAELAQGGWIEASPASPAEYRVPAERWLGLLELESAAPWRNWHGLFAFLLDVDEWIRGGEWREESLEDVERRARSLVDAHRRAFKWAGVAVPEPLSRPGSSYLESFGRSVLEVAGRMHERV